MKALLLGMLLTVLAISASAVDPECVEPVVYDPAVHGQYDATQSITFCTPQVDVDGQPLQDGDLTRCTVKAADQTFAITSSNRAGQYVNFATPETVKSAARFGSIEVFCENAAGVGASEVASDVRFRNASAPGKPYLLR